jgi:hypothetical protein
MDPQATWDQLLAAFADGDWDAIEEHATALKSWLDRGGFPPTVTTLDLGPEWHRALAIAGCNFALETIQSKWSIPQEQA